MYQHIIDYYDMLADAAYSAKDDDMCDFYSWYACDYDLQQHVATNRQ